MANAKRSNPNQLAHAFLRRVWRNVVKLATRYMYCVKCCVKKYWISVSLRHAYVYDECASLSVEWFLKDLERLSKMIKTFNRKPLFQQFIRNCFYIKNAPKSLTLKPGCRNPLIYNVILCLFRHLYFLLPTVMKARTSKVSRNTKHESVGERARHKRQISQ